MRPGEWLRISLLAVARYWCRRLVNQSELVCWLWHCAATVVALKRHERVNAFNVVDSCLTGRQWCWNVSKLSFSLNLLNAVVCLLLLFRMAVYNNDFPLLLLRLAASLVTPSVRLETTWWMHTIHKVSWIITSCQLNRCHPRGLSRI